VDIEAMRLQASLRAPLGPRVERDHAFQELGPQSFQQMLDARGRSIRMSAHAMGRLQERRIAMDADRMARLADGVDRAAAKGSRDSLVMVDHVAFVVSVRNRTVITAVDGDSLKDNVFTKIDSAVIA
jgi:flagellar operon protein